MFASLAQISKKWSRLSYPRFCVQAENELNPPPRRNDLSHNFSIAESVRGWLVSKPINGPVRANNPDLRQYIDNLGRPDKYALGYCNNSRHRWNDDPGHHTVQVYRISYRFEELKYNKPASTRGRPRSRDQEVIEVIYDFLQTLRGRNPVGQLQEHLENEIGGLGATIERIQSCTDTRAVDRAIEQVLQENVAIQTGGGP